MLASWTFQPFPGLHRLASRRPKQEGAWCKVHTGLHGTIRPRLLAVSRDSAGARELLPSMACLHGPHSSNA